MKKLKNLSFSEKILRVSIFMLIPLAFYIILYVLFYFNINLSAILGSSEAHGWLIVLPAVWFHHYYLGLLWGGSGVVITAIGLSKTLPENRIPFYFLFVIYLGMLVYWFCFYLSDGMIRIT